MHATRQYRQAVEAQLSEWPGRVRAPWVAYVPAHQGAAWAALNYPEWSTFITDALAKYRADVHEPHQALIDFTDHAVAEAERLIR